MSTETPIATTVEPATAAALAHRFAAPVDVFLSVAQGSLFAPTNASVSKQTTTTVALVVVVVRLPAPVVAGSVATQASTPTSAVHASTAATLDRLAVEVAVGL